jgi:sucrose-phosphate synthase
MHVIFLNPQGNFDAADSHLAEHPDFGGQLVYVKEVAQAMTGLGHKVDIVTRRIEDPAWPEFAADVDLYPGFEENLRILRFPCGGPGFLAKERLWPHMGEFVDNFMAFYGDGLPDFATAHYADGGYCAVLAQHRAGVGFTFTGHSLGAQKLDKLGTSRANVEDMEARFRFSSRIAAERLSMARAARIITSTDQERQEQYGHALYAGAVDPGDEARFVVIPPGVNAHVFTTEAGDRDATVHDALDTVMGGGAGPAIVVSGRLDEKKNVIGVVHAYAGSPALRDRATLVLCVRGMDDPYAEVGNLAGAEQEVLKPILATITDAGIRDKVLFLNIPSQSDLAATYRYFARRGSVFALTSFYEPFGLAPIEAAACGLAPVATRYGGPTEIFADGSGVLVDPFDADDIGHGLLQGLDNHARLSAKAVRRVREVYTWQRTAEAYLAVIKAAMKDVPARCDAPPELDAGARIRDYLEEGSNPRG